MQAFGHRTLLACRFLTMLVRRAVIRMHRGGKIAAMLDSMGMRERAAAHKEEEHGKERKGAGRSDVSCENSHGHLESAATSVS